MYLGVRHIKVIPADKGKCGIDEKNPYDSCIEYVGEDKDAMCLVSLLYSAKVMLCCTTFTILLLFFISKRCIAHS